MKKIIKYVIYVFLLFLFTRCLISKSTLTAANITEPVLVGKVKTIGGEPIENSSLQQGVKFNASLTNSWYVITSGYSSVDRSTSQGSNQIDEQLLSISDNKTKDSSAIIIADQIRFEATSGYWLFVLYTANKGWIEGAKYYNRSNEINK
jgi:hypothetical protein